MLRLYDNYPKPTSSLLEFFLKLTLKLTSWRQLEDVVLWQIQGYLKVTEGNFVLTDKKEEKNDHLKNSKNF